MMTMTLRSVFLTLAVGIAGVVNPGPVLSAPTETVLWSFAASGDSANPEAGLLADNSDNLYGTTSNGGTLNKGTVFKLTPPGPGETNWTETVLWNFGASGDGTNPFAGLIADKSGALFGTTRSGGTSDVGTVFKLTPPGPGQTDWTESVLWSFGASGDGGSPYAGLLADKNGTLYGTTGSGGTLSLGTVYKLTPPAPDQTDWTETVLWNFGASGDGVNPRTVLIADKSGALYGTTESGGTFGSGGTVFKLTPPGRGQTNWTESILWSFSGFVAGDGALPTASLIADKSGTLYGTTQSGGTAFNLGTVFKLTPPAPGQTDWIETVLWSFGATGDGRDPHSGLIADKSGALYGTTLTGGASGQGTVFKLVP